MSFLQGYVKCYWEILLHESFILLYDLLGMPRMQGPDNCLRGSYLKVVFAPRNLEAGSNVFLWDKEEARLVLAIK